MNFINVGFGNLVAADRIVSVVSPESAPIKRLCQDAKENGSAIDVCCGKKCRSVLICDSGHVVLSAMRVESVGTRLRKADDAADTEEEAEL